MNSTSFQLLYDRLANLTEQCGELHVEVRRALSPAELDPEMSLTRSRKILEFVVHRIFELRIGEPPGKRPLENLLHRLSSEGHLPKRLAAYANSIREMGNLGTHHREIIQPTDVLQCLTQLAVVLEWYFEQTNPVPPTGAASKMRPPQGAAHSRFGSEGGHRGLRARHLLVLMTGLIVVATSVVGLVLWTTMGKGSQRDGVAEKADSPREDRGPAAGSRTLPPIPEPPRESVAASPEEDRPAEPIRPLAAPPAPEAGEVPDRVATGAPPPRQILAARELPKKTSVLQVKRKFPAPGGRGGHSNASGLCWDGKDLRVVTNSLDSFQVSPEGKTLDAMHAPEPSPLGMDWDGGAFWMMTTSRNQIIRFVFKQGKPEVLNSFKSPAQIFGGGIYNDMAWDGREMWFNEGFEIHAFAPSGKITRTATFSDEVGGLTWDGSHLWVAHNVDRMTVARKGMMRDLNKQVERSKNPAAAPPFELGGMGGFGRGPQQTTRIDVVDPRDVGTPKRTYEVELGPVVALASGDDCLWALTDGGLALESTIYQLVLATPKDGAPKDR